MTYLHTANHRLPQFGLIENARALALQISEMANSSSELWITNIWHFALIIHIPQIPLYIIDLPLYPLVLLDKYDQLFASILFSQAWILQRAHGLVLLIKLFDTYSKWIAGYEGVKK